MGSSIRALRSSRSGHEFEAVRKSRIFPTGFDYAMLDRTDHRVNALGVAANRSREPAHLLAKNLGVVLTVSTLYGSHTKSTSLSIRARVVSSILGRSCKADLG